MKNRYYRFDTAISFIDFHRFPLSIDTNHLTIEFYRLTSPGYISNVTQKCRCSYFELGLPVFVL